jgi:hypothetical protein
LLLHVEAFVEEKMVDPTEIAKKISQRIDEAFRSVTKNRSQYVDEEDAYTGAVLQEITRNPIPIDDWEWGVEIVFRAKKFRSKGGKIPPETQVGADFGLVLEVSTQGKIVKTKAVLVQAKVMREKGFINRKELAEQARRMGQHSQSSYVIFYEETGARIFPAKHFENPNAPVDDWHSPGKILGEDLYLCTTGDKRPTLIRGIKRGLLADRMLLVRVNWMGKSHFCTVCGMPHL